MNTETILGLVIFSSVAVLMFLIGLLQFKNREKPVGFFNTENPPEKEEITDVLLWNKKHGMLWILYGICIELGFLLGSVMPLAALEIVFTIGGVIIPLPVMIHRHYVLERTYRRK